MSAFHPIWDAHRTITGVAGMDFSITNIVDMIKDVRIAQTGSLFWLSPSGNVLAVNDFGEKLLGLNLKTEGDPRRPESALLSRDIHQSTQKGVAVLKLPHQGRGRKKTVRVHCRPGGRKKNTLF